MSIVILGNQSVVKLPVASLTTAPTWVSPGTSEGESVINAGVMLTFAMVANEVRPRGGFEKSFSTHLCRTDIYCAFHIHQMLHCRANRGLSLMTSDVEQRFMEAYAGMDPGK